MSFKYLHVKVIYNPNDGYYNIHDEITGHLIGFCNLLDGPGWVYSPTTLASLMAMEVCSIGELLIELNSMLEE